MSDIDLVDIDTDERQVVRGVSLPAEIDVPQGEWYRPGDDDGDWGFEKRGLMYMARQAGLYDITSEVIVNEESGEGIHRVLVKVWLAFETGEDHDDQVWSAYGGADETMNPDPEHVWSVAETRALNRAIRRALGIHQAGDEDGPKPSHNRSDPVGSDDEYTGPPMRPEDDPGSEAYEGDDGNESDDSTSGDGDIEDW